MAANRWRHAAREWKLTYPFLHSSAFVLLCGFASCSLREESVQVFRDHIGPGTNHRMRFLPSRSNAVYNLFLPGEASTPRHIIRPHLPFS